MDNIENSTDGVSALVSWENDPRDENGAGFYTDAHVFVGETEFATDFPGARAEVVGEREIEIFVPQSILDRPEFETLDVPLQIAGCRYNDSYGVTLKVRLGGDPQAHFSSVETTNIGSCISIDRSATRVPGRGSQWLSVVGAILAARLVRRRARTRR